MDKLIRQIELIQVVAAYHKHFLQIVINEHYTYFWEINRENLTLFLAYCPFDSNYKYSFDLNSAAVTVIVEDIHTCDRITINGLLPLENELTILKECYSFSQLSFLHKDIKQPSISSRRFKGKLNKITSILLNSTFLFFTSCFVIMVYCLYLISTHTGLKITNIVHSITKEEAIHIQEPEMAVYEIDETYTFSLPKQYVALTFTKGPSVYSEQILKILQEQNVAATFFLVGSAVEQFPDVTKSIANAGFSIGYATQNYSLLTSLSLTEQNNAIIESKAVLTKISEQPITLFRPPYNVFNADTKQIVENHHLKLVSWNVNPGEANAKTAETIIEYLEHQNLHGAIINLEETSAVVQALPTIVDMLKHKNLEIIALQ